MKKLHSSNRGLTFSITPNEQYYPGGHYIYEVRPTCIIIRPSKSGLKISKKRSGANINALFDLRSKKVRDAVSRCSHMEMEVLQDKIIVRCIRSIKDKIVPSDFLTGIQPLMRKYDLYFLLCLYFQEQACWTGHFIWTRPLKSTTHVTLMRLPVNRIDIT